MTNMNERSTFTLAHFALPIVMIGVACFLAVRATAGLEWPCESDFYRDMGGAQAILDGRFGSDPAYLGEVNWFNPLQPAVFAGLSVLTGLPLHVVYARLGPFVNLLGPLGFYLMAMQMLGRRAALAALGAYLFLGNPAVPSWFQATYSPWAWPMDFAQGFFFLTVAAFARGVMTQHPRWDAIAGVLLGITFLAHTAPTLVFVFMIFLMTLFSGREERPRAIWRLLVVGSVSLLVAAPFLGPLLLTYKMHVLNDAPSRHAPIGTIFVLSNLISLRAAVAVLGGAVLLFWRAPEPAEADAPDGGKRAGHRAAVVTVLCFSSVLLLTYGLMAQGIENRGYQAPPRVLPTYHFHLYLKAAESLLFGIGLAAVARFVVSRLEGNTGMVKAASAGDDNGNSFHSPTRTPPRTNPPSSKYQPGKDLMHSSQSLPQRHGLEQRVHPLLPQSEPGRNSPHAAGAEWLLLAGLLLAAVVASFPRYHAGIELTEFRADSERIAAEADRIALYDWVLKETRPSDVFLADLHSSLWAISAADRKVVCMDVQYSNIYVSYTQRADDLDRLYSSLSDGDVADFKTLADKYQVTHVILVHNATPDQSPVSSQRLAQARLTLVFDAGSYRVFRRN